MSPKRGRNASTKHVLLALSVFLASITLSFAQPEVDWNSFVEHDWDDQDDLDTRIEDNLSARPIRYQIERASCGMACTSTLSCADGLECISLFDERMVCSKVASIGADCSPHPCRDKCNICSAGLYCSNGKCCTRPPESTSKRARSKYRQGHRSGQAAKCGERCKSTLACEKGLTCIRLRNYGHVCKKLVGDDAACDASCSYCQKGMVCSSIEKKCRKLSVKPHVPSSSQHFPGYSPPQSPYALSKNEFRKSSSQLHPGGAPPHVQEAPTKESATQTTSAESPNTRVTPSPSDTAPPTPVQATSEPYRHAPACHPDGQRCAGSPDMPFVPYAPCCTQGYSCLPKADDWGMFCQASSGSSENRFCIANDMRCAGAPGHEVVQSGPCCGFGYSCKPVPDSWGRFCVKDRVPPILTECHSDNTRCAGAPGWPEISHRPCCSPSSQCMAKSGTWGRFCTDMNEGSSRGVVNVDGREYTTGLHIVDRHQGNRVVLLTDGEARVRDSFIYVPSDSEIPRITSGTTGVRFAVTVNDSKIATKTSVTYDVVRSEVQRPYYKAETRLTFDSFVGITSFEVSCVSELHQFSYNGFYIVAGVVLATTPSFGEGPSSAVVLSGAHRPGLVIGSRPSSQQPAASAASTPGSNSGENKGKSVTPVGGSFTGTPFGAGKTSISSNGTRYDILSLIYQPPDRSADGETLMQTVRNMQVTVKNVVTPGAPMSSGGLLTFDNSACSPLSRATLTGNGDWAFANNNCDIALQTTRDGEGIKGTANVVIRVPANRMGECIVRITIPGVPRNGTTFTTSMKISANETLPILLLETTSDGIGNSSTTISSFDLDYYGGEVLNFTMLNTKEPQQRQNCTEYYLNLPDARFAAVSGDLNILGIDQQNLTFVTADPRSKNERLLQASEEYTNISGSFYDFTAATSNATSTSIATSDFTSIPVSQVLIMNESETHAFVRIGNDSMVVPAVNLPLGSKMYTKFASRELATIDEKPRIGNETYVLTAPLTVSGYSTRNFSEFKSKGIKVALGTILNAANFESSKPVIFYLTNLTTARFAVFALYEAYLPPSSFPQLARGNTTNETRDSILKALKSAVGRGDISKAVRIRRDQISFLPVGPSLRTKSSTDLLSGLGAALGVGGIIAIVLLTIIPLAALCVGLAIAAKADDDDGRGDSLDSGGNEPLKPPIDHAGLFIAPDRHGRSVNGVSTAEPNTLSSVARSSMSKSESENGSAY
jgi:hypothetical protein